MAQPVCLFVVLNSMTHLTIEQAPAVSLPRRFLLSAPLWGVVGGTLLLIDGASALQTRWQPQTLALVHIFTLGVLGNTMLGSLMQFLPAAAAVRVRGGAMCVITLHSAFNLGVALLVIGLHAMWLPGLTAAAVLLPASFLLLGAMALPGVLITALRSLLHAGIAIALGFSLLTAGLGGVLALSLSGRLSTPIQALVDIHASWGVLGWVIVLIASVARVVMPMFQGTGILPAPLQATWFVSLTVMLLAGAWRRLVYGDTWWLMATVVVHACLFALAALWLQWRASRLRRGSLLQSWRYSLALLVGCTLILPSDPRGGLLVGLLAIGCALPLLVVGMALEIVAFLGWIDLHRQCGRGIRLPSVQHLLPETDKARALAMQLPAIFLSVTAVCWPMPWLVRVAGASIAIAWLCLWFTMHRVSLRTRVFLRAQRGHQ